MFYFLGCLQELNSRQRVLHKIPRFRSASGYSRQITRHFQVFRTSSLVNTDLIIRTSFISNVASSFTPQIKQLITQFAFIQVYKTRNVTHKDDYAHITNAKVRYRHCLVVHWANECARLHGARANGFGATFTEQSCHRRLVCQTKLTSILHIT